MYSELVQTEIGGRSPELLEETDSPVEKIRYTVSLLRAVAEKYLAEHVAGQNLDPATAKTEIRLLDYLSRAETRISKGRHTRSSAWIRSEP